MDPAEAEEAKKRFKQDVKARMEEILDSHSASVVDNVKLHEEGWKERYYTDKCKLEDIDGGKEAFRST